MTKLLKISTLPAVAARSILTAIQSGERLAPAPYFVSTFVSDEKTTGYEELFQFLQQARAAYDIYDNPAFAAYVLVGYLCGRRPEGEEEKILKSVYHFIDTSSRVKHVIEAALKDLEYIDDNETDTIDLEGFEGVQSVLTDILDEEIHTTGAVFNGDKTEYEIVENGTEVTSAVSDIRSGLKFFWIKNLGMYAACSGYVSGDCIVTGVSDDDIPMLDRFYFGGLLGAE
jgi:hypothetical protein